MGTEEPLRLSKKEMEAARGEVQAAFAHLADGDFIIASDKTETYNCAAWAAGENHRKWWPRDFYWPEPAPRNLSKTAFKAAFSTIGYKECSHGDLEQGYEKIALYMRDNRPTHMARQFPTGKWTTKLGDEFDIAIVNLDSLSGGDLGRVTLFMKRPAN